MKANGGVITQEDLASYEAVERAPLKSTFKGYEIIAMPPPSSGGAALIEMMNLMEVADISKIEFNSTAYVHLVAESHAPSFCRSSRILGRSRFQSRNAHRAIDFQGICKATV